MPKPAITIAALSAALAVAAGCPRTPPPATGADLARVQRWWILIGHAASLDSVDWRHAARDTQMVVLAGDPRIPLGDLPRETIRLGYLSLGEVSSEAATWQAARQQSYLVESNPDWPSTMRVDVRDQAWRRIILEEEAPRLLRMGFQGFMLDTIDTAPYLEGRDPARFAGERRAMSDLVRELRQRFPARIIIANGTDALADVAPFVDGYVVEGVFATYDFGRRVYRPTTEQERAWKLAQIERAEAVAARPVFTIEYADLGDIDLGRWAAAESERRGFRPCVTVRDLNAVP
jgi:polysaccharide biosynthesis protein PelA